MNNRCELRRVRPAAYRCSTCKRRTHGTPTCPSGCSTFIVPPELKAEAGFAAVLGLMFAATMIGAWQVSLL